MFVYIRSAAFVIVVTQTLVFQQSKNVTAKCTETLLPPPCIQFSLVQTMNSVKSNNISLKYQRFTPSARLEIYGDCQIRICGKNSVSLFTFFKKMFILIQEKPQTINKRKPSTGL